MLAYQIVVLVILGLAWLLSAFCALAPRDDRTDVVVAGLGQLNLIPLTGGIVAVALSMGSC